VKVIQGIVNLSNLSLRSIPEILRDVEVQGNLHLDQNNLINLNNCPQKVSGLFQIDLNQRLKSLVGGPSEVGAIIAHDCKLQSLEGFPKISHVGTIRQIFRAIRLDGNDLKSLVGLPTTLPSSLNVSNNALITLKGSPEIVNGDCDFSSTNIKSLEGCPSIILGDLHRKDSFLENESFWPKEVRGNVFIGNTPLSDKLFPRKMTRNDKMMINDIFKSINAVCKIGGDIYEYESDLEKESNYERDYDYDPENPYDRL